MKRNRPSNKSIININEKESNMTEQTNSTTEVPTLEELFISAADKHPGTDWHKDIIDRFLADTDGMTSTSKAFLKVRDQYVKLGAEHIIAGLADLMALLVKPTKSAYVSKVDPEREYALLSIVKFNVDRDWKATVAKHTGTTMTDDTLIKYLDAKAWSAEEAKRIKHLTRLALDRLMVSRSGSRSEKVDDDEIVSYLKDNGATSPAELAEALRPDGKLTGSFARDRDGIRDGRTTGRAGRLAERGVKVDTDGNLTI